MHCSVQIQSLRTISLQPGRRWSHEVCINSRMAEWGLQLSSKQHVLTKSSSKCYLSIYLITKSYIATEWVFFNTQCIINQ